jgi:hypothetical protein
MTMLPVADIRRSSSLARLLSSFLDWLSRIDSAHDEGSTAFSWPRGF